MENHLEKLRSFDKENAKLQKDSGNSSSRQRNAILTELRRRLPLRSAEYQNQSKITVNSYINSIDSYRLSIPS
jgi:hypothetical protein